jgi:hypothetical protein
MEVRPSDGSRGLPFPDGAGAGSPPARSPSPLRIPPGNFGDSHRSKALFGSLAQGRQAAAAGSHLSEYPP